MLAVDPTLTATDLEDILYSTAQDIGPPGEDDWFGSGLVDAFQAVKVANGGALPGPPRLSVTPKILNFDLTATSLNVTIKNLADQFLQIDSVTPTTRSGVPWLTVTVEGPATPLQSASRVRAEVSRLGLPEGSHRGLIEIVSNGGTAIIDVLLLAPPAVPVPPPDVDVYVIAIRLDIDAPNREVVVNPLTSLTYAFPSIPIGDYRLVASTDLDQDGVLCEDGEYCGSFPLLSDPETVTVFQSVTRPNVNFSLTRQSSLNIAGVRERASIRRVLPAAASVSR